MDDTAQTRTSEAQIPLLAYAGVAIGSALVFFAGYGFAVSQQSPTRGIDVSGSGAASSSASAVGSGGLMSGLVAPDERVGMTQGSRRVVLDTSPGEGVPLIRVEAGVATEVVIMSPMHGMPGWVGLAPHSVSQPIADGTVMLPPLEPGAYTLFGEGAVPVAQVVAR